MQRRGGSEQPVKGRRSRAIRPKARKAPTARLPDADLQEQLDQRTRERDEALEQQTATIEVLRAISSSAGKLEPIFDTMLKKALRLCGAQFGHMLLFDGEAFTIAAMKDTPTGFAKHLLAESKLRVYPGSYLAQLVEGKKTIHVPDLRADKPYLERQPRAVAAVDQGGLRSQLMVPMLKEDKLIGSINIYRQQVRPFNERQIALVESFAAQAVIAIENARLLTELRQRTDDLSESLEQQTATSTVLKVISSSPGELEPVFDAMLANATRICQAKFGTLYLRDGDGFHAVAATRDAPPAYVEARRRELRIQPSRDGPLGCAAITKQVAHVADMMELQSYRDGSHPQIVEAVELGKFRTALGVPMLKDDEVIGVINIFRQEVRSFTEKQIELVQNFAAQAVIAIENTRLLTELRESLEQQTATSEVLKVISSSPGELEPVFNAMLANATHICEAKFGTLYRYDGGAFHPVAFHNVPLSLADFLRQRGSFMPPAGIPLDRLLRTKKVIHTVDQASDQVLTPSAKLGGARTHIAVPMLKEEELVGAIIIYRQEVRPFTDKQIELVSNFAAQAVIAIENTRLLNELRESLQQQTATADVLKTISSSTGQLEPVFSAMLENAVRICEAKFGSLVLFEGNVYRRVALYNAPAAFVEAQARDPVRPLAASPTLSRVAGIKQCIQVADIAAEQPEEAIAKLGGARTVLCAPMLNDDRVVGVISIYRQEVRSFTDKQTELVTNFAAQAAIAIENARLLNELRESLQQQTATADVLKVISRSTFDLKTVLTTLVETAVRVCEADIGNIARPVDNDAYKIEASFGQSTALYEELARQTLKVGKGSVIGRTALSRAPVHILDAQTDPDYELREALKIGDYHTMLGVPLVREGNIIGVFGLARKTVRAFTEKQIELVTTFADQAVIAIENVRLFESVETRTRELAKSLDDLRTAQDRLVQTEKLASLGQLTAGIAHEIKNPLNFVNNFSVVSAELIDELQDVLKRVSADDKTRTEIKELTDTLHGNLDKVVQHGKRADAIVKNMLLHSREGSGEHRVVDINALVEESLNLA
ncbi:MAG: GAF domain-containing protein, partial [Sphingobacteriales bacterium]